MSLREYRKRYGLTQEEVVSAVRKRAQERGDPVIPGLDQCALSRHENGHKRPGPYYQALYCEVFEATPAELGFRLALPGENGDHEDMDRREFLASAASFVVTAALPVPTQRLGSSDIAQLRQSVIHLDKLADQHGGAGAVYEMSTRTFRRLLSLHERASYSTKTGQELRALTGLTAHHAGWMAFDAQRDEDARRWWHEAMHWSRLAESDSVGVVTMVSMAVQASEQHRPREVVQLATVAQSAARSATPRLRSVLHAREAVGHAGAKDARSAHEALRRARECVDARQDQDPSWLDFYGPAGFATHEYHVALMLGDLAAAEESARTALALHDAVAYPRNHALYLIRLANVLVLQREIDEGAAVAKQATVAAAGLDSARVTRGLQAVAQSLALT